MMSTGFDPSLVDPAESESVARSVEDSLTATDEVQVWVDATAMLINNILSKRSI
jgi:hypothetical protein